MVGRRFAQKDRWLRHGFSVSVILLFAATTILQSQTNPHGKLSLACTSCHTTVSWKTLRSPLAFDHSKTSFALTGAHVIVACKACHTNLKFAGTSTGCYPCHRPQYLAAKEPDHANGRISQDCQTCHTTVNWKPATFDHNKTNFALTGLHRAVACEKCHTGGRFAGTPTDCYSCHRRDFMAAKNPNHVAGRYPTDCSTCHSLTGWTPAQFNHAAFGFPLTGRHATVACAQCHTSNRFAGTPADCYSCHRTDFAGAMNPDHTAGQFSHDCAECHTSTSWAPSTFSHSATAFPLTGAHATVSCQQCHVRGLFKGTPTDCYTCHKTDFNHTASPAHVAGGFSHNCSTCHTLSSWKPATFNHSSTGFVLTGAHASVACESCHKNGQFAGTPSDCYTCHRADFTATVNPNHVQGQFNHDCLTCHTTIAWQPSIFDHNKTNFRLTGAHVAVACQNCHKNGQFAGTPTDCYTCHRSDFTSTTNPNHVQGQFTHDCTTCHTNVAWQPATFDHNKTSFPLTGAHANVSCQSCHKNGQFAGTPTDCYTCHQSDFTSTTNPNHVQGQFSHDCTTCHTNLAWQPATFDHSKTSFPLTGAHASVSCQSCHKNGQFAGTPTDCYSCHSADFSGTTNPNHVQGQFSHDCTTCHSTTGWQPSTFDHSKTSFPLTGAHLTVACQNCHKNGQFAGTPTDCYSCHSSNFASVTDPNHVAGQFSHDCTTCHSTAAWQPATFDHSKTAFPLTGAHVSVACASCHVNGKFAGTPTDCYSCHKSDYNSTTNPVHSSAGFPTTCQTCHTTTTWAGATFNHTWFPTSHGNAQGVCMNCHTNPNDFSAFQCTVCHTQAQTDPHHTGVRNYVYASPNCYSCHPNGRGG